MTETYEMDENVEIAKSEVKCLKWSKKGLI